MVRNNPGNPVTGSNLFGRKQLIDRLWERLQVGTHLQLTAPRRVGKTSLMLELKRVPRPGWHVIYLNVEGSNTPGQVVAQILVSIATHPELRTWLEGVTNHVPFRHSIQSLLGRFKSATVGDVTIELEQAIGRDWLSEAKGLGDRLSELPANQRLLIILDELPILLGRMFRSAAGREEAIQFLDVLRALRQRADLGTRVQFIVGGSVGLSTVLQRHRASATANDLYPQPVPAWSRPTADAFLSAVATGEKMPLSPEVRTAILDKFEEFIPFHLQLMIATMRDAMDGGADTITVALVDRAYQGVVRHPHLNHYAERLQEELSPEDHSIARGILKALSVAKNGLTAKALAAKLASANIAEMCRLLEDEGYITQTDGSRIQFRTEVLRLYWKQRQATFDGDYA